ncbi:MFS transporter [Caballeronia sp. LjRoot31]
MVAYGFGLWLPSAIKAASALNVSPQMIGWLNALPYLASVLGLLFITHSSDRFQERRLHVAIPLVLIGVLLYAGSRLGAHLILLQMVVFTLIGFFLFMNVPLVSALITDIFPRELAIPTIAVTGGIGNLAGGFIGPLLVGGLKQMTGNFSLAFGVLGAVGILGGVFVSAVRPLRLHQSDTQSSLATDGRAKQS